MSVKGTQKAKRKRVRVKLIVQATEDVLVEAKGKFSGKPKVKVKSANAQISAGQAKNLTLKGKAKRKGTAKGAVAANCTNAAGVATTAAAEVTLKIK